MKSFGLQLMGFAIARRETRVNALLGLNPSYDRCPRLYGATAPSSSHRDPRRNAGKKGSIGPAVPDWCKFATLGDNLSNGSHYVFSEPFPTVMLRVGRNGRI